MIIRLSRRSLFEKDKLLFAFLLCSRIMLSKAELDAHQVRNLILNA